MAYREVGTGATAVGLRVDDGVVLAAEKRISYGGYVLSRVGKKVFLIKNRFGLACAGLFADIQTISRLMNVEIHRYELEMARAMNVRTAAKLLSIILYQYKYMPFLSEIIFGGVDDGGPHIFVMDPLGSLIEDNYAAVGTGAPVAIGVIESEYKKGLTLEETEKLAVKAVKAAISRDAVSGDGVDVAVISVNKSYEKFYQVV
ncbi:MAG: archaeal proteasome endopeptidase complex subunit beta [Sulfolobales archaeon]|nr:archaeal proteasome endopeptidase complex subunit beta [Sulfolobales archaeon]MCX8185586.1 archaeal proteasome endopeptidase complex subunit beta [Sulfolobales archaeon]MDW7969529.1 archaeal proteasome endopeptidase complex subunit beta [Sulfolobales archaeon]